MQAYHYRDVSPPRDSRSTPVYCQLAKQLPKKPYIGLFPYCQLYIHLVVTGTVPNPGLVFTDSVVQGCQSSLYYPIAAAAQAVDLQLPHMLHLRLHGLQDLLSS